MISYEGMPITARYRESDRAVESHVQPAQAGTADPQPETLECARNVGRRDVEMRRKPLGGETYRCGAMIVSVVLLAV
jgi:hypothetical protein